MNPIIIERASAKINLYLHVTGKRDDGYHTLDSLVVFASHGDAAADHVTIKPADAYALTLDGPQAVLLKHESTEHNLITKALRSLGAKLGRDVNMAVTLYKNLPVASGIGGGSADAAAALRGAATLWGIDAAHPAVIQTARETGADVLACLLNAPCYMGGIGEQIEPIEKMPRCFMVLVNPNIPLPTPPVFKARTGAFSNAARFDVMPSSAGALAQMLAERKNDLEAPAKTLCAAITDVLDVVNAQHGCLLARLSGSGATCFGLFDRIDDAENAAQTIRRQIKEWWVAVSGF
jgi:4-diphosphocytidyl-2-C-methyl-D-erythritol kinase